MGLTMTEAELKAAIRQQIRNLQLLFWALVVLAVLFGTSLAGVLIYYLAAR